MSEPSPLLTPAARVRAMQVIVIAELLGGLVFMGIVLALRARGPFNAPAGPPLLSYIMPVVFVPVVIGSVVVPRLAAMNQRRHWDEKAGGDEGPGSAGWYGIYQTTLLIGIACLEGTTFGLLVAYLIDGQPWTLILAALPLAGIAVQFPTRQRVETWIERQRDLARQEQQRTL